MASNRREDTSPETPQTQSSRYDESSRQESIDNQQERAVRVSSRILEHVTGNPKGIPLKLAKSKRVPRLYYINNNQTILIILQGDITRTKVDAIVNAANEHMTGGSGVDGIIHHAAGNELYKACKAHKQIYHGVRLPTGHSRILLSYDMSPTTYYIINTAGPMYSRYKAKECAEELSSCYATALALANLYDLESIGFTAISCGIFGYPANDGADVALRTVNEKADLLPVVVFVLWDNHIYDAWVQKAEELKFTVFDFESSTPSNPSTSLTDDNQAKTIQSPTVTDDQQEPSPKFTSLTSHLSTQSETEKTSEDNFGNLTDRLPSVPSDSFDTQNTENMEHKDTSIDSNQQLTTQNTVEMTNFDSEKEDSTSNDNDQQQPAQEGSNKLKDEETKTHTIQGKTHHSVDANNPEDTDNEKIE